MHTEVSSEKLPVVLIVEDDFMTMCVLEQILKQADLKTLTAINGVKAIDMLKANSDITHITLDLNMPVMDGYGFLDFMNRDPAFDNLKVIVNSCTSKSEFIQITQESKISTKLVIGYFEKPFIYEKLIKVISNMN